jgi:PAP2 superfamily
MTWRRKACCFLIAPALLVLAVSSPARAQVSPPPNRDQTWGAVSSATVGTAALLQLVMPRIFYADPETTVGWKARWHVSQLAPVMTLTVLTLASNYLVKDALTDPRPGCDATNQPGPGCNTYGMPSSHALGAFAALGNGAGVWLFDTVKWSGGRFNGASFTGDVILPLILAGVTDVGRSAGNWETTNQILVGSGVGLVVGFATGAMYALLQRPECGYTGNLICW